MNWLILMVLILGIVLGISIGKSGMLKNNVIECGEYQLFVA